MTGRQDPSRVRRRRFILVAVCLAAGAAAQAQAPEPPPASTALQLMQAVLFPNANVVFTAQSGDPASIARDARPSLSTNPLSGLYGGWQAIENSGLAIAEAADLLNVRGRVCASGTAVPVQEAEWKTAVRALRESGLAVAAAAKARSQERVGDATEPLTDACTGCHRIYRVREKSCTNSGVPAPALR